MQQRGGSSPLAPAVMVHFYRAAMDLTTTWRARIDGTTNWAVLSCGSISSFVLGSRDAPHIMALLGMFLAFAFLSIEARRFRFYDLWSGWIRIMETEYYGSILRSNVIDADQHWHPLLQSDLEDPYFKITWSEAMGNRLRHNYIAIFGFLLLTWLTKLLLHPTPVPFGDTLHALVSRAGIGPIPGPAMMLIVCLAYLYLIGLMVFTPRLRDTGTEVLSRNLMLRRLVNPRARLVGFKARPIDVPYEGPGTVPEED
jgi:uncharacterized membrane protein